MIVSLGVGSYSGAMNFGSSHGVREEGNQIREGFVVAREACYCKLLYQL
jgi:hypothetical protein